MYAAETFFLGDLCLMENFRIEHDSMGEVKVPSDKYVDKTLAKK